MMFCPLRLHPHPFSLDLCKEKTAGLLPYLKKECFFFLNKNFGYEIDNLKGVFNIELIILNRKVKPLIVP